MADPEFSALWAAFRGKDGKEHDRVIVGVGAAFVFVAAANGRVDAVESARFLDVVRGSRLASPDEVTSAELRHAFEASARTLLAYPEAGRAECLRVLSDFGFDAMRSEIIWSAANAALLADARLEAAERRALEEIREALRIRPAGR